MKPYHATGISLVSRACPVALELQKRGEKMLASAASSNSYGFTGSNQAADTQRAR